MEAEGGLVTHLHRLQELADFLEFKGPAGHFVEEVFEVEFGRGEWFFGESFYMGFLFDKSEDLGFGDEIVLGDVLLEAFGDVSDGEVENERKFLHWERENIIIGRVNYLIVYIRGKHITIGEYSSRFWTYTRRPGCLRSFSDASRL